MTGNNANWSYWVNDDVDSNHNFHVLKLEFRPIITITTKVILILLLKTLKHK